MQTCPNCKAPDAHGPDPAEIKDGDQCFCRSCGYRWAHPAPLPTDPNATPAPEETPT